MIVHSMSLVMAGLTAAVLHARLIAVGDRSYSPWEPASRHMLNAVLVTDAFVFLVLAGAWIAGLV